MILDWVYGRRDKKKSNIRQICRQRMELGDEALVVDGHGQINLMGFEDHKQNYWDNKSNNFNPQKAKKSDL